MSVDRSFENKRLHDKRGRKKRKKKKRVSHPGQAYGSARKRRHLKKS